MGLLSYLRGSDLLESTTSDEPAEARSLPMAENELPLFGGYTASTVTPAAALAIGDVWAAVRVLADAASSLPIHVYRKIDDGRERVTSGRLVELLDRPGPATTQADLVSSLMSHLAIWGNAYLAKYRQDGEIVQLGLLHPERVRPELEHGQLRFRYSTANGHQRLLTEADLVHIKGLTVDGLSGLSAVGQASRVLGLSDELVKHALAYFESATPRPAGVLRLDVDATESQRERNIEGLKNEAQAHGILVVRGDTEYIPIGDKLDDAQFTEQRRLAAQEIARVFRIPPHMLGAPTADSMTYSNVEQQSLDFVRYSLTPWLRRIELAVGNDRDLCFVQQFVKFAVDALLRPDSAGRAAFYTAALDPISGWLDVDEVRRLEDLPPRQPGAQPIVDALNAMTPVGVKNGNGN